ncbi:hypothetical protein V1506DRAFT_540170 [Lipomyces tetrasporus]
MPISYRRRYRIVNIGSISKTATALSTRGSRQSSTESCGLSRILSYAVQLVTDQASARLPSSKTRFRSASCSVRTTQGRTVVIAQVSGGLYSFNTLRSRCEAFTISNQRSIPRASKGS